MFMGSVPVGHSSLSLSLSVLEVLHLPPPHQPVESLLWGTELTLQLGSYASGSFCPTPAPETFEAKHKFASVILQCKGDILPLQQWVTHI